MNLFIREMKTYRKSIIIWIIGILFMVGAGMSKFSTAVASGQSMNELVAAMPRSLQVIFGIGTFDLTKAVEYYGVLFFYLVLMAAIHSVMLGAGIISKEERDKTVEFLMAKPISRTNIITAKLLAAMANVIIFNLVTLASSVGIVDYYAKGNSSNGVIVNLMIAMFIVQIIFLSIGAAIASMGKKPKVAVSIATGILLISFLFSLVIDLSDKMKFLRILSPFKYFDTKEIIMGRGFDVGYVILSIGLIIVMVAVTYLGYRKRDLRV